MSDYPQNQNSQGTPATQYVVISHEARSYRGLAITSWVLIFFACGLAVIPVLGFISWAIAFPVFLATFILSIMTMSRGGALQGVLILIMSIFVGPIIVGFSPIITSMLGIAGVGGAAIVEMGKQQEAKEKLLIGNWLKDDRESVTFHENKNFSIDGLNNLRGTWSIILSTLSFISDRGTEMETIQDINEKTVRTRDSGGGLHTYVRQ
jgi:hypothetical protein